MDVEATTMAMFYACLRYNHVGFSHQVVSWGYCEQKKEDIVLVGNRYESDWVWTRFGLGLIRTDGMDWSG